MNTEATKAKTHRQQIEELISDIERVLTPSRNRSIVITKLEDAQMRLGRHLKEINESQNSL